MLSQDPEKITFLADPTALVTKTWGLEWELGAVSLGLRSKRFSLLAVDGKVQAFNLVEDDADKDAAVLLAQCQQQS